MYDRASYLHIYSKIYKELSIKEMRIYSIRRWTREDYRQVHLHTTDLFNNVDLFRDGTPKYR